MEIKGTFPKELTGRETYKLTMSNDMVSMTEIQDDTLLTPSKWCHFIKDGTELLTAIFEETGDTIYVTSSKTFLRTFDAILGCLGDNEPFQIRKVSGKSKSNRNFINCELV